MSVEPGKKETSQCSTAMHHLSLYLFTSSCSGILVPDRQNLVNGWSNWKSRSLVLQCGSLQGKQKQSWSINPYSYRRDNLSFFLYRQADEHVLRGHSLDLCWFWTTFVYFWSSAGWLLPLETSAKLSNCCNLCWLLEVSLGGHLKTWSGPGATLPQSSSLCVFNQRADIGAFKTTLCCAVLHQELVQSMLRKLQPDK